MGLRQQTVLATRRHLASAVFTDANYAYRGLNSHFAHESVDHQLTYVLANVHTNGIENFWSLFKRQVKGTYIHVAPEHMQAYVDEQADRFNEHVGGDSDRFIKATQSVTGRRLTYRNLTASIGAC